ncbi:MAG: hypothetical protein WCJ30_06030 [Deltaproteobacteria bacterium]
MLNKSSGLVRRAALSLVAAASFACGAPQHNEPAPVAAGAEELSFEATTIHPGDTEAPEAPPSGSPLAQSARRGLDGRHGAVAQCYATILRTTAEAVGRIAAEITVSSNGHVERVSARTEGEGGIGTARVCVEAALRGFEVANVPPAGLRIRRSYSFVNPPIELSVAAPLAITPPRRAPAARRGAAAASAAPSAAPTGPAEGATGPLTVAELTPALEAHTGELAVCYATALRTARTAAGAATLNLTVGGDGVVTAAELTSEAPAVAAMSECVGTAMRAIHLRASGTGATVHVPVTYARQ